MLFDEKATWNQEQSKGEQKVINVEEIKRQSILDIENNENSPQVSPPSSSSSHQLTHQVHLQVQEK